MNEQQRKIVKATKKWLNTPYRHQASMLGAGCDCLGLLRGVWRELIGEEPIKMPPYKANWRDKENASALLEMADRFLIKTGSIPKAGDIILFQMIKSMPPKHCAIMINDNCFIHSQEQIGVTKAHLTDPWQSHIHSIYQFPKIKQK